MPQLLEATLAAACDYCACPARYCVYRSAGVQLEQAAGSLLPSQAWLSSPDFLAVISGGSNLPDGAQTFGEIIVWQSFWLVPLRSTRPNGNGGRLVASWHLGTISQPDLLPEEQASSGAVWTRGARAGRHEVQEDVFIMLEGVIRETSAVRQFPTRALRQCVRAGPHDAGDHRPPGLYQPDPGCAAGLLGGRA